MVFYIYMETAIKVAKNQAKIYEFNSIVLDPDALFVCAAPNDSPRSFILRRDGFEWHIKDEPFVFDANKMFPFASHHRMTD